MKNELRKFKEKIRKEKKKKKKKKTYIFFPINSSSVHPHNSSPSSPFLSFKNSFKNTATSEREREREREEGGRVREGGEKEGVVGVISEGLWREERMVERGREGEVGRRRDCKWYFSSWLI